MEVQGTRSTQSRARYDYMDALRATLIIGGVLFHAALPYRAFGDWNVREAGGSAAFDYLADALYSFRMPTFFFVAGFFCALTFATRRAAANLRRRLLVFGLPLLSFMVIVQPMQYMLRWRQEHPGATGLPDWTRFWSAYLSTGAYVSHLWFLLNLIAYYVAVHLALSLLERHEAIRRRCVRVLQGAPIRLLRSKTLLALACALVVLPIYDLVVHVAPRVPGYGLEDLVLYLPFFLAGFFCYHSEEVLGLLSEVRAEDILLLILGIGLLLSGIVSQHLSHDLVQGWLYYQAAWTIGMLLVALFRRWFDLAHPAVRAVSDASYTIYLFHHIVVILLATLLLGIAVPGGYWSKYVLVVVATTLLTFAAHHYLIRHSSILSWAFNGRAPSRRER